MTTISSATGSAVQTPFDDAGFDEAQLAAASFLARYGGRTLEAYRQDLRGFFQWAADHDVPVLAATRPHIELWRGSMEERGLAASTIDRRLSTVCGFYRFAHIDGRIGSNPAEYVRRPQVHPSDARRLDRTELGMFVAAADHYDNSHQALAVLLGLNGLRVSEACETNVEGVASTGKRAGLGHVHPHMLRSAFIMAALDAGVPLRDVQTAARHSDPRTTTIYDRRRQNFDRHAAYVVVAFVAGG